MKPEQTDVFGELFGALLGPDPHRPSRMIGSEQRQKMIAFGWYGGKYSHLTWLLPLLSAPGITTYCEPFGGSAAVLLNRDPAPVEAYNDIDGDVVNFFRVLRDETDALVRAISLTPFAREEYALACGPQRQDLPAIERARRFYVRARQTRTGLAQTASVGRWANCIGTSRSAMAGVVSRWVGGADRLEAIANRLAGVQIENRPALDMVETYDTPATLFYIDPPYLHATRGDSKAYGYEMSDNAHQRLAAAVSMVAGLVAVSGYDSDVMRSSYPTPGWRVVFGQERTNHASKGRRTECLWVNYDEEGRRLGR